MNRRLLDGQLGKAWSVIGAKTCARDYVKTWGGSSGIDGMFVAEESAHAKRGIRIFLPYVRAKRACLPPWPESVVDRQSSSIDSTGRARLSAAAPASVA
jgi:hypothetical protein